MKCECPPSRCSHRTVEFLASPYFIHLIRTMGCLNDAPTLFYCVLLNLRTNSWQIKPDFSIFHHHEYELLKEKHPQLSSKSQALKIWSRNLWLSKTDGVRGCFRTNRHFVNLNLKSPLAPPAKEVPELWTLSQITNLILVLFLCLFRVLNSL